MIRVRGSVEIARAPQDVSTFLAHTENDKKWQEGVVHLQLLEGTPAVVGCKYERVQQIMGRNIKSATELAAHEPGKRVTFKSAGKAIEYRTEYDLASQGATGTRLEFRMDGEMLGFASMFESVVVDELTKGVPAQLSRLKSVLEAP